MRSILAAVDRDERSKSVARRAAELAHLTGAHLELFLCDAERAYVRQHQYDSEAAVRAKESCLEDSRRYLESLRRELGACDVEISLCVGCESPLYVGIVHAVERDHPDLVIRGIRTEATAAATDDLTTYKHSPDHRAVAPPLDAGDWDLVSACPAPLLLTRGKPWKERPVIAAAVDLSPGESTELTRSILVMAADVAKSTGGVLKAVHACRADRAESEIEIHSAALGERVRSAGIEGVDIHVMVGEPATALRGFVCREEVDLIVLGALTHRKTLRALVGTLTGRLMDTLEIDFLLVKPAR
ncbi:MAG: universal stress protein [Steroidobacterales bacterium]|jgi:universal stress protein E